MTTSLLTAFTTQLINFCDELILLFPEDNDFKVFKNGILLLKKTNPRQIIKLFHGYVKEYYGQILNKEESFFLENDYDSLINEIDSKSDNIIMTIGKLKQYWGDLSENNKESIWKYLHVLINLNEMISSS